MIFTETKIPGCFVIELETREDDRGFFARLYCEQEFRDHGIDPVVVQINTALTKHTGTIRGMHFQRQPHADTKTVRCLVGSIYDVCVDLRPESVAYCEWVAVELSAANRKMLFLPSGTAHAYQTLTGDSEIMYTTNETYNPESATGVRYNDPTFAVDWPLPVGELSEADLNWPDFIK